MATVNFDVSGDWEVADGDGTHTVSFYSRLTESTFAQPETGVDAVVRENVSAEEMEKQGLLAKAGVAWHVWAAKLTATPKVHDVVQDAAGARWVVLDVETATLGTRYKLTTVRER